MIRSNKKVNGGLIKFETEGALNVFYGLTQAYNKLDEYRELTFSKKEIWDMTGFKGEYNFIMMSKLVDILTKPLNFDVTKNRELEKHLGDIKKIGGSMFIITIYHSDKIMVEVPKGFQELLFFGKDLNLMSKAKKKEKLSIAELDYYDREVRSKSKELVLLVQEDMFSIKGKYNLRLYTLLKQWDKVGIYEKKWTEFKEILEIPKSYKASMIDARIFDRAKSELLKANIKITKIEKIKKGRSIDKIIIHFKTLSNSNKKYQKNKIIHRVNDEPIKSTRTREEIIRECKGLDLRALNIQLKIFGLKETTLKELKEKY